MTFSLTAFAIAGQEVAFVLFGCALFAAGLFVYVFYQPGEVETGEQKTRLTYLLERKEATYENLRDLNFEYRAGKVPDVDYQNLKASLQDEAAALLAEIARLESRVTSAPRRARS